MAVGGAAVNIEPCFMMALNWIIETLEYVHHKLFRTNLAVFPCKILVLCPDLLFSLCKSGQNRCTDGLHGN